MDHVIQLLLFTFLSIGFESFFYSNRDFLKFKFNLFLIKIFFLKLFP